MRNFKSTNQGTPPPFVLIGNKADKEDLTCIDEEMVVNQWCLGKDARAVAHFSTSAMEDSTVE